MSKCPKCGGPAIGLSCQGCGTVFPVAKLGQSSITKSVVVDKYDVLSDAYEKLKKAFADLGSSHASLQLSHSDLLGEHAALETENDTQRQIIMKLTAHIA